jgi:hypothetical protein
VEMGQLNHKENYCAWEEYNYLRARLYELFKYNYKFMPDTYRDISEFIREHYNMLPYHEKNKEWSYKKYENKQYKKMRIKNVLLINNSLFGKRTTSD